MKEKREEAETYVVQQLGYDEKWTVINHEIWDVLESKPDIVLSDLEDTDDVLTVLAVLLGGGFLKQEYIENNQVVDPQEVVTLLKAWHRDKTLSDEEWKERASKIRVQWKPTTKK